MLMPTKIQTTKVHHDFVRDASFENSQSMVFFLPLRRGSVSGRELAGCILEGEHVATDARPRYVWYGSSIGIGNPQDFETMTTYLAFRQVSSQHRHRRTGTPR